MEQENQMVKNEKSETVESPVKEKMDLKMNKMQEIEIEKIVFNCGGTGEKLDKSEKLLEMVTGRKIQRVRSTRRIPAFGISPKKESGCKVTIRDKDKINDLLKRFFVAVDNKLSDKQITKNYFSFGIHEYIEIPGLEYDRDIGISGFELSVVFKRKGKRVKIKKIKRGKYPERQNVSKEEIIAFLNKNFKVGVKKQNDSKWLEKGIKTIYKKTCN